MNVCCKVYPGNKACKSSGYDPREVKRSIVWVKQVFAVVVVSSLLAMSSVFRTLIFVFVPTGFMKYMLTFCNDFVAFYKGSFAEIAGLFNQHSVVTHIFTSISGYVFSFE